MMTRNAIEVWSQDFKTILFGVGIGGAGQAMYDAGLTDSPKEIVQNEYASLLLEVGLLGIFLAVALIIAIFCVVAKTSVSPAILTLLLAYGISLLFFAGLPNALHIYLLPACLWIVLKTKVDLN
jgi:O-antigen ligase